MATTPPATEPSTTTAAPAREWLSYEDGDGTTWLFDASFLASDWTCIFGCGCQGVLTEPAPELAQGCCSYGAHFADGADRKKVRSSAARLRPDQWQLRKVAKAAGGPIAKNETGDWATLVVDDACVFLNRPGFDGGIGCALHAAALEAGERPMDWKPDVCWQVPLRLVSTTDENGRVTNTLREWHRRDWGEGGEEFAWWCTDTTDAFVGERPAYRELHDEIAALVGDEAGDWLAAQLDGRPRSPWPAAQAVAAPTRRRR